MLLYITAEDVFGGATPERKGPRPLHTIPPTLSALYDMGMRHHLRRSVLSFAAGPSFESWADWQLDRRVIRVALYSRENLGLEPGTRAAVFGRLSWLWPVVDFAVTGFGATSVGIEHDVADEALVATLREAEPRVVFATDGASASRLQALRSAGRLPPAPLAAEGLDDAPDVVPLERLFELGGTLDTAERAQAFRAVCRGVVPESAALWHAGGSGLVRLTHAQAMERIGARLRANPPRPADVAYVEAPRAALGARLALAAGVGDGFTTTALGSEGRAAEDLGELRPHAMCVGVAWLESACDGRGPRWPAGLDRARARRRLRRSLGDRLRWVETDGPVNEATTRALVAAGVDLSTEGGAGRTERSH
jgi:hypothetical protein